jgi:hypothetical protein
VLDVSSSPCRGPTGAEPDADADADVAAAQLIDVDDLAQLA